MPDFENFVARHGEAVAQWLVEIIERQEGINPAAVMLEDRWESLKFAGKFSPANNNHQSGCL